MTQSDRNTSEKTWLSLIGDDRADLGRAVIRLAHLATAQHCVTAGHALARLPYHATTHGRVEHVTDQPMRASQRDPSQNTEVLR